MSTKIIYVLYTNGLYLFLGGVYLFWVWKDTRAIQNNKQKRWGEKISYLYYTAIGIWPFLISIWFAMILAIYGVHILSLLDFSIYYLGTGFLYYYSGWRLLPKLYKTYGTSLYPSLGFVGITQLLSGLGIVIGAALLSLTFGFPFNEVTQMSWYLTCFGIIGFLFVIMGTARMLNHLNRRIDREKKQGSHDGGG